MGRLGDTDGVRWTRIVAVALMVGVALAPWPSAPAREGASAPRREGFDAWLLELRREAAAKGISEATLDAALTGLVPLARVLELDRRQREAIVPLGTYVAGAVTPTRVREGRARLRAHRETLTDLRARYGVPPGVVVALWGLESDYGRSGDRFPVIGALATLAYDGRRGSLFRAELLDALRIVDEGHVPIERLRGSWAGATGQSQFLPSSFLRHAVDGNGDGQRDIWTSPADVLASIASYLSAVGWQAGEGWGVPVRLPAGLEPGEGPRTIEGWRRLGVTPERTGRLPAPETEATLVAPDGGRGPAFLLTGNLRALLHWNRSVSFAVAVGTLADRLESGEPLPPPRPVARRVKRRRGASQP